MKRAPDLAAIHAAELRIAHSMRNSREGLRRAQVAFRANLARPSTLALSAGAAGLLGFWIARRPQPGANSSSDGVRVAATASVASLVLAFIVRYGMRHLPVILEHAWAAWQRRAASVGPELSKSPAMGYPETGLHH